LYIFLTRLKARKIF